MTDTPLPIKVAVVAGSGTSTGDGRILVTTPGHGPDWLVKVISPAQAIAVRFVNTFGVQFIGLVTAAMTPVGGHLLYTRDFLHMAVTCASLALPGALLGLAKDIFTVFGKLEGKYPLLTGSA